MKTGHLTSWLALIFLSLTPFFPAAAQEDTGPNELRPTNPLCPILRTGNITAEVEAHTVRLYFPTLLEIDRTTLSDGDLTAIGPDGLERSATFVDFRETPFPTPRPVDPVEGLPEGLLIPFPDSVLIATYRFEGPWTTESNGRYLVRLEPETVANHDGRFLPGKLLGGFSVTIGANELEPIQPTSTSIDFRSFGTSSRARYYADVTLTFREPFVRINWGDLNREENTFSTNITAVRRLGAGIDPPIIYPAETISEINENIDQADIEGLRPADFQYRYTYRLGDLDSGSYTFTAIINDLNEGTEELIVSEEPPLDLEGPKVSLEVKDITNENEDTQQLVVTYTDPSGVDVTTLGDDDLTVYTPWIHQRDPITERPIFPWRAQHPKLVNVMPLDRRMMTVKATYEMEPPNGTWTSTYNGSYPVIIGRDAVCDIVKNCNRYERLGGFEVSISETPIIEATAEIEIDSSNSSAVSAKVHVDFAEAHILTSQTIRREGNRLILVAEVSPDPDNQLIDPSKPGQLDLSYRIGPLDRGSYIAAFVMNGVLYDREAFVVIPTRPIPARVDLTVNETGTEAQVTLQFSTPHLVEQSEVTQARGRIILPAKATPLALPITDNEIELPEPIVLTYQLGALDPGDYLAVFELNSFAYLTEEFTIGDPEPPIPAEVNLRVDQLDNGRSLGIATIQFETPHVIVEKETLRTKDGFIFDVTARALEDFGEDDETFRPSRLVTVEFPLGILPPGDYRASFVMNGATYARTTWTENDIQFDAKVETTIAPNTTGSWIATVRISFDDNQIRMNGPGTLSSEGRIHTVNAEAFVTLTDDLPPEFYEFSYDLGNLEVGPQRFLYKINDRTVAVESFTVPRVNAEVDLAFDTSGNPDTAKVTIQTSQHYEYSDQTITRRGRLIMLSAKATLLPVTPAATPDPVCLEYELGELEPGSYFGVFILNDERLAFERFTVDGDRFEAEVKLSVETTDETSLTAVVDIDDPFVIVTDPGTPQIEGNRISINATAAKVDFFTTPSGDPQTLTYELGDLSPGLYFVSYMINSKSEARLSFRVEEKCRPLPHLVSIRSDEENMMWFTDVKLALFEGQQIMDWGTVTLEENKFRVEISVDCIDHESPVETDPADDGDLPDGFEKNTDGEASLRGLPIELISHRYQLGELANGVYSFCVYSRGQRLACRRFRVEAPTPKLSFGAENITELAEKHEFSIGFTNREFSTPSIEAAKVWIEGPDNYREEAVLEGIFGTQDIPQTSASFTYSVNGPGGSWDRADNGRYRVFIENEAVMDSNGNPLAESFLGSFSCRILPRPKPGVSIELDLNAEGNWQATVEIESEDTQQLVVEKWEPLVMNGHSFVALPTFSIMQVRGPVTPVSHTYDLGQLQPGYFVFALKSNLAHCGVKSFKVPGVEDSPFTRWAARRGENEDRTLSSYFFALSPELRPQPNLGVELVDDDEGQTHLGLRFRRLTGAEGIKQTIQASSQLGEWHDVSDQVDVIERTLDDDGTEIVLICLRQTLSNSPYKFLRVHLEEE